MLSRLPKTTAASAALLAALALPGLAANDEELIAEAMSAAPPAVGAVATIMAFNEDGSLRTLREGTSNFVCFADDPTPGHNPMCLDQNGVAWAEAWINKTTPPAGKVGFGYMLAGGGTPSNTDPYGTLPAGTEPAMEPPHVMIFNLPEKAMDYPRPGDEMDMTQPWVMWKDTPYEHLMIPVK
ncbi:hypothetical protein [Seohaeicola zhoushanensis]|uniref:Secreted protein n=1 Tax=Seohaeicola zhoushanensis TaxID=1569283 RepID=A0A8J3GYM4_9RHOB|nr:hypothetical protein [Seohaeicola zhoushanensis]GHF57551.1 hypothetical protein GCM10017056_31290 [Seohaeicola zhoushanensis]